MQAPACGLGQRCTDRAVGVVADSAPGDAPQAGSYLDEDAEPALTVASMIASFLTLCLHCHIPCDIMRDTGKRSPYEGAVDGGMG